MNEEKQQLRNSMIKLIKQNKRPTLKTIEFDEKILAAYIPLKSEIDIVPLIEKAMEDGKTVVVPTQDPMFFAVLPYNWKENLITFPDKSKGIYSDELIATEALENTLMLVPGLAFTKEGKRLGRGCGFYDRVLRHLPDSARTIGICRKCQVLSDLPCEPHDKKVKEIFVLDT